MSPPFKLLQESQYFFISGRWRTPVHVDDLYPLCPQGLSKRFDPQVDDL